MKNYKRVEKDSFTIIDAIGFVILIAMFLVLALLFGAFNGIPV